MATPQHRAATEPLVLVAVRPRSTLPFRAAPSGPSRVDAPPLATR